MARKVYCPSTGSVYIEASENAQKLGKIGTMYEMPHGHCMFKTPWHYGRVACNDAGIPGFPSSKHALATRLYIVKAMRRYWAIAKRPHSWAEIYPEACDSRSAAIAMAKMLSDRGYRFTK